MKSLLALLIACLLALLPAGVLGWRVADGIREHFGAAFVRNFTALNREKILAPLSRELALSQRLADSAVLQQWLRHEAGESERAAATRELHSFRRGFRDHVLFVASAISGHYFFESGTAAQEPRAAYTLSRNESKDSWFYTSLASNVPYNINVNYDRQLKTTKVWLNVLIRDGEALGIAGTGLDLSGFLREFISRGEAGVTPLIVDDHGAIQAHPDESLIVLNAGAGLANSNRTVFDLLDDPASRNAMRTAMQHARAQPGLVASDWVAQGGVRKLLAVSYISELNWHVITLLDLDASSVVDAHWLWLALLAVALLIGALLLGFAVAIERMVLKPLRHLQASASAIAGGNYALDLPVRRDDEIGELSQAFGTMASKVQRHTQELESKVRERTAALLDANQRIVAAHQQLDDSIRYASLIQRAILPDRDMVRSLGAQHFVLWRPRDVVGGDFYIFRADGPNCLIGVADCAGHGVPGALMTMLARAAIDQAINLIGPTSPAALLNQIDAAMRTMLRDGELPSAIATSMDVGLCYIDRSAGLLRFAGARMSLYWSDGATVEEIAGNRRALCDKRVGAYQDQEVPLQPERTYYLLTDGILDQAGGELGYGFGSTRLAQMLREHAGLDMAEQAAAFEAALLRYQGSLPQRDDMTLLSFRFN